MAILTPTVRAQISRILEEQVQRISGENGAPDARVIEEDTVLFTPGAC